MSEFLSLRSNGSPIVPYAKAWEFQKELLEKRIRDEIPDTFLFVEHPPTVTRGRGLQWKPDRLSRDMPLGPLPFGTEYFEIERGGDLTWHGPGQLVIYPIVKLDGSGFGPNHDVTGFLRKLEASIGVWLRTYGLHASSVENAAGIWVTGAEATSKSLDGAKKIASVGIAVRKWVTYHGIGLNLANSLEPYRDISPCGFSSEVMTTLTSESLAFRERSWNPITRAEVEKEIASEMEPHAKISLLEIFACGSSFIRRSGPTSG